MNHPFPAGLGWVGPGLGYLKHRALCQYSRQLGACHAGLVVVSGWPAYDVTMSFNRLVITNERERQVRQIRVMELGPALDGSRLECSYFKADLGPFFGFQPDHLER